jgi:1,4-alpha-glucan branching enzyme
MMHKNIVFVLFFFFPYLVESNDCVNDKKLFYPHSETMGFKYFGAHFVKGGDKNYTIFRVYAPKAKSVEVISEMDHWSEGKHKMIFHKESGVWALCLKGTIAGMEYKYKVVDKNKKKFYRNDPYGRQINYVEEISSWNNVIYNSKEFYWEDANFIINPKRLRIMEVHPGTIVPGRNDATFREIANYLLPILLDNNYNAISLMPISHHNLYESWGYQPGSIFAVDYRHGTPDDLKYLVNTFHKNNIAVIVDLVHGHASSDYEGGIPDFDGSNYFFKGGRMGHHPQWGTRIYNYDLPETRNYLLSNARYWAEEFHIDGYRVDAVSSMLYLDYGRKKGEWDPAPDNSNFNYGAQVYLKAFNKLMHSLDRRFVTIAEFAMGNPETTSSGSEKYALGFDYMWRMKGMHLIRGFVKETPGKRNLKKMLEEGFNLGYYTNYINSHDEVSHYKRYYFEYIRETDNFQKFAMLRNTEAIIHLIYPGVVMNFQGDYYGNPNWWNENTFTTPKKYLDIDAHKLHKRYMKDLGELYLRNTVFRNIEPQSLEFLMIDKNQQVLVVARRYGKKSLIILQNYSSKDLANFTLDMPFDKRWSLIFNSDKLIYGGKGLRTRVKSSVPYRKKGGRIDHKQKMNLKIRDFAAYSTVVLQYE